MDQWQQDDEPDHAIELAIQISIVDYNERGKAVAADDHLDDDEDEDLSRAIEESLKPSPQQIRSFRRNSGRNQSDQIFCDVCDRSSPGENEISVKSDHWNQCFCRRHIFDGTPVCCSCGRLKGKDADQYMELGDTRNICQECFATSITNKAQQQSLIDNVTEFMTLKGLEVKGYLPIFWVDKTEMIGHASQTGHPETAHRAPGMMICNPPPGYYVENVESISQSGSSIMVEKQKYPLDCNGAITILLLFGLPKALTGSILAHELMHVWFRQAGVYNLEDKVEEGICQVIAHEWLGWFEVMEEEASSSSRSQQTEFDRTLRQFYKDDVEIHSSPTYGDGFREAKWAVEKWGPHRVISNVLKYGTLPQ